MISERLNFWFMVTALYPSIYYQYRSYILEYQRSLAKRITEFFDILYLENNIEKSHEMFKEFSDDYIRLAKEINSFTIRQIINSPLAGLF